jgi:dTDP-4-amino-4,6-dideoxygalactose transaminase
LNETRVAFNDLSLKGRPIEKEVREAMDRVIHSGWFILGPEVEAFERELAAAVGARHAIGVASGTDAISLALLTSGIGDGDEVVTTPLTAAFTALAISRIGARPVFADVEETTLQLSPTSAAERITERCRALVPVHLYGNACAIEELSELAEERNLVMVEDACQAHGATFRGTSLGTFGRAGAFSFYPTKNLGALGDGGAVVTDDDEVAAKVRRLRNGGQSSRYRHDEIGFNSRLDELQAAVLRVRLRHLAEDNEKRRRLAKLYEDGLAETAVTPVEVRDGCQSARHLMVVRTPKRDELIAYLASQGIQTLIHYPIPTHRQPAYRDEVSGVSCPVAEEATESIVSLPLYPSLPKGAVERVIEAIRRFYVTSGDGRGDVTPVV